LLIMVDGFQNKLSPKNASVLVHRIVMNASPDKKRYILFFFLFDNYVAND